MSTPIEDVLDDEKTNNTHLILLVAFGLYISHIYASVIDDVMERYILKDQYNLQSLVFVAIILTGIFVLLLREKNII